MGHTAQVKKFFLSGGGEALAPVELGCDEVPEVSDGIGYGIPVGFPS